jgi:hypothetical protein
VSLENGPSGSARTARAGIDRRRSQRALLRVGITLHFKKEGKAETCKVYTVNVSAHGALMICPESLPLNSRLVLEHNATREQVDCRVARIKRASTEGFEIGIEFEKQAPDFWKMSFPSLDWKPTEG